MQIFWLEAIWKELFKSVNKKWEDGEVYLLYL